MSDRSSEEEDLKSSWALVRKPPNYVYTLTMVDLSNFYGCVTRWSVIKPAQTPTGAPAWLCKDPYVVWTRLSSKWALNVPRAESPRCEECGLRAEHNGQFPCPARMFPVGTTVKVSTANVATTGDVVEHAPDREGCVVRIEGQLFGFRWVEVQSVTKEHIIERSATYSSMKAVEDQFTLLKQSAIESIQKTREDAQAVIARESRKVRECDDAMTVIRSATLPTPEEPTKFSHLQEDKLWT